MSSYRRDNEAHAGPGAIAAIDGVSPLRRRIRAQQAMNTAQRERKMIRYKSGMGLVSTTGRPWQSSSQPTKTYTIEGSFGPRPLVPPPPPSVPPPPRPPIPPLPIPSTPFLPPKTAGMRYPAVNVWGTASSPTGPTGSGATPGFSTSGGSTGTGTPPPSRGSSTPPPSDGSSGGSSGSGGMSSGSGGGGAGGAAQWQGPSVSLTPPAGPDDLPPDIATPGAPSDDLAKKLLIGAGIGIGLWAIFRRRKSP